MTIEDVVESLNVYVEEYRRTNNITSSSYFVMKKSSEIASTFKAYKSVTEELYLISNKTKSLVLTTTLTDRVITGRDDTLYNKVDAKFILAIYDYIRKDKFIEVLKDEDTIRN